MTYFSRETHLETLRSGLDVPDQPPSHPLPISEVGLTNKTVWVRLPEGRLAFQLTLLLGLAANRRGIHMSRLEEVLSRLSRESFDDLTKYAEKVGRLVFSGQQTDSCRVKLTGKLPVEKRTAFSGKISSDAVTISAEMSLHRAQGGLVAKRVAGLAAFHMTACPCTQCYAAHALGERSLPCPLPTHSQRSETELYVRSEGTWPSYALLYECLDESLHLSQDLLKRPDEAEFVLKVHSHPQFVEDAVRQTAATAARKLVGHLPHNSLVEVVTTSFESIHIHDVQCRLVATLGEMVDLLDLKENGDDG